MATVCLQGVSKRYDDGTWGVRDVDLDIADREFLVLVGPSGCGKSTTLRMIAGLEDCTAGDILIAGANVSHVPPAKRNISMVFQNYALYPHMTVYRNIGFGLLLKGGLLGGLKRLLGREDREETISREEIDRRIRQTADKLGIAHLLKKRPHQLSGGERQRVALGRAIARNPAAFLFDEPLSNLDAKLRTQMRVELKRLHQQLNSTMIYVTHDQVEAMTLGDRIAVMNAGELQQVGTPAEVYGRPANEFVAKFIGNNPVNLFTGQVTGKEGRRVFVCDEFETEISSWSGKLNEQNVELSHRVKLGIRPENMTFVEKEHQKQPFFFGHVAQIDELGDSTLFHVDTQFTGQILLKSTRAPVGIGERVGIGFDVTKIHLFDSETGVRLENEQAIAKERN